MNPARGSAAPQWTLAIEAAALLAVDPCGLGGLRLHARSSPARDTWLAATKALFPGGHVRRLPHGISDDRLLGGLDLAATLKAGRPIADRGLLAECDRGLLLIPSAERLTPALVARLAQVMDRGATHTERDGFTLSAPAQFAVIALDEHIEGDDGPPGALLDRLALTASLDGLSLCDLTAHAYTPDAISAARARLARVDASDEAVAAIVEACNALAITSARTPLFALRAARAKAALDGRDSVGADDLALAASLVLAPRTRALPDAPPPPEPQPEEQQADTEQKPPEGEETPTPEELAEMILAATRAALPPDLLARLKIESAKRERQQREGRAGAEGITKGRGRPAGTRAGRPDRGARLNVLETLRAAAPWQRLRGRTTDVENAGGRRIEVRMDDFRITRTKKKNTTATIFVVDASGSAALHRLAEAKGAVELLLADCYVRRDEVALIAFRGKTADVLLEPTRSLARAKRSLAALPGGGGTPMAAAIERAHAAGLSARRKGHTPTIVFLTDGRANIDRAGRAGRRAAADDAESAAKRFAADGLATLVIDTSVKRAPEAEHIARALSAVYLALPHASAATVSKRCAAPAPDPSFDAMDWDRDGKTWPDFAESRFVSASALRWRVVVKGQGPVLLLVHGTGASAHSWSRAAKLLGERFTVVMPDLPGHGFTATPAHTALSLPAMAAALGDLMKELGLSPRLVAGHSAGAAILIEMCLRKSIAPDTILSFNGALLPFHGIAGKIFSPLAKLLVLNPFIPGLLNWRAAQPGAVEKILAGTGSVIDRESIALYERLFRDQAHVAATLRMMAEWDLDRFAERIPHLDTGLILIAGDKDAAVPPQTATRIKALVRNAEVAAMPGTGHLSHEEDPATAAAIIQNALIPLAHHG